MIRRLKRQGGLILRGILGMLATHFEHVTLPFQVVPQEIGQSHQSRSIICYTLGTGGTEVLIVGGIHGNEVGTVKLAYKIIDWLTSQPEFLARITVSVVPCLNPDGYAIAQTSPDYWRGGRIGRFNARNVDLNRNFPTQSFAQYSDWSHGKNYEEQTKVFCGEQGGSEPETQALIGFIKKRKITTYIALHSAGKDVLGNNTEDGQVLAKVFSAVTGYVLREIKNWHALQQTGTAKEWTEEQGVAYIEIEAASRWSSDWRRQKTGLTACLQAIATSHATKVKQ